MRFLTSALLLASAAPLAAQMTYQGPAFTRNELAPGIHAFVFDNPLGDAGAVDGTAVVIINESDVIVVDAQWSAATAGRVVAEIRKLTPNPVRYVSRAEFVEPWELLCLEIDERVLVGDELYARPGFAIRLVPRGVDTHVRRHAHSPGNGHCAGSRRHSTRLDVFRHGR